MLNKSNTIQNRRMRILLANHRSLSACLFYSYSKTRIQFTVSLDKESVLLHIVFTSALSAYRNDLNHGFGFTVCSTFNGCFLQGGMYSRPSSYTRGPTWVRAKQIPIYQKTKNIGFELPLKLQGSLSGLVGKTLLYNCKGRGFKSHARNICL